LFNQANDFSIDWYQYDVLDSWFNRPVLFHQEHFIDNSYPLLSTISVTERNINILTSNMLKENFNADFTSPCKTNDPTKRWI